VGWIKEAGYERPHFLNRIYEAVHRKVEFLCERGEWCFPERRRLE